MIDRSANGGETWQVLTRADTPNDLGTADTFTDSPRRSHTVTPGQHYVYRVFPVFIVSGPDAYGAPALIDASSRGADLPTGVRNLDVDPDGQHALDLSWRAPSDDGGHEIEGYLIQVTEDDGDGNPEDDWETINPVDVADPLTVSGKDTTTYKYRPTTTTGEGEDAVTTPDLSADSTRWFRVIAITDENDGNDETGGTQVDVSDGSVNSATDRSPNEPESPSDDDIERADPEDGTTASLGDAASDKATVPPEAPVDLTAEAASRHQRAG